MKKYFTMFALLMVTAIVFVGCPKPIDPPTGTGNYDVKIEVKVNATNIVLYARYDSNDIYARPAGSSTEYPLSLYTDEACTTAATGYTLKHVTDYAYELEVTIQQTVVTYDINTDEKKYYGSAATGFEELKINGEEYTYDQYALT